MALILGFISGFFLLAKSSVRIFLMLGIFAPLLFLEKDWKKAHQLIDRVSLQAVQQEGSPLHFPYGCLLYAVEGPKIALAHFSGVMETPYPPTTALPSYFVCGKIDEKKGWIKRAFWWEKKELYRQIDLFYKIIGKHGKTKTAR